MQIQTIEPPIPANDQNNGRKSQKITLMDGTTCFANASMTLNQGDTYDNLEINTDNFGNKWLNFIKGNGGPPPAQQPPPPEAPQPQPAAKPATDPVKANIFLQGMLQQAIASGVHDPVAVWDWARENYPNFRDRKPMTPFPGMGALTPADPGRGEGTEIPF